MHTWMLCARNAKHLVVTRGIIPYTQRLEHLDYINPGPPEADDDDDAIPPSH